MKLLAYKKSWRIKNSSTKMPTLSPIRDPHQPDERQHDGQEQTRSQSQKWVDRLFDAIVTKLNVIETNELKIKPVRQHSIIPHRFL
jgi:hypothetical protein